MNNRTSTCEHCGYTTNWRMTSEQRCSRCDNWLPPFAVDSVVPMPINPPTLIITDNFELNIESAPKLQHRSLNAIATDIRNVTQRRDEFNVQMNALRDQIKIIDKEDDKLVEKERELRNELNEAIDG